MLNHKSHWENVYQSKEDAELGWYEPYPETTLNLIDKCNLSKEALVLNVGAGTTTLIDGLIKAGYSNIIANDLSKIALDKLKERIKLQYQYNLWTIVDDLTNPKQLGELSNIDLWIDRAVLHFFLKKEERQNYFGLIKSIVSKGGYVLIAVFNIEGGAKKCSGLPLYRYNAEMLQEQLGFEFNLVETFNYTYVNPFGDERPYLYTLFRKQ